MSAVSALPMCAYTILITDQTLQILGDPILSWLTIDVTVRFNEAGSGLFTCPGFQWIVDMLVPGSRVVIIRKFGWALGIPNQLLTSGPVESWLLEQSDNGENSGVGKLTVNFADDFARIATRLVYPDPTQTATGQTTDSWTFTGNAEVALRNLVNLNAGPGALAVRRIPQLALGTLASVGSTITVNADRMQPIGNVMRLAASVGGGLGFRTRQSGTSILFEVYQPENLSADIRFGFALGNMQYRARDVTSPKATAAIVGGQGTGGDRALIERNNTTDETLWGRSETLVSRGGTTAAQELQDDGDSALADNASTTRLSYNVSDTPAQRYGVDYQVGSVVSVETGPGTQLADTVVTVHLQAWATAGEVVSATIGSQAAKTDPMWVQVMNDINTRLGKVERNVMPAVV